MKRRTFLVRVGSAVAGFLAGIFAQPFRFLGRARAADGIDDIPVLMDQMWSELMQTTITGAKYERTGQPDTGHWGAAKALRDRVKNAGKRPTVQITSPAAGATVSGTITITGTAA